MKKNATDMKQHWKHIAERRKTNPPFGTKYAATKERVLALLRAAAPPVESLRPKEISDELGDDAAKVRRALRELAREGTIASIGHGFYKAK